jgi:integrase/recombinase XerC
MPRLECPGSVGVGSSICSPVTDVQPATARKLPTVLSAPEVRALLDAPASDTVLGLRDRAMLALLYGTGIRASECATVREGDVDLSDQSIRVTGKGGHQRVLPLTGRVIEVLQKYRTARGPVSPSSPFFRGRTR